MCPINLLKCPTVATRGYFIKVRIRYSAAITFHLLQSVGPTTTMTIHPHSVKGSPTICSLLYWSLNYMIRDMKTHYLLFSSLVPGWLDFFEGGRFLYLQSILHVVPWQGGHYFIGPHEIITNILEHLSPSEPLSMEVADLHTLCFCYPWINNTLSSPFPLLPFP